MYKKYPMTQKHISNSGNPNEKEILDDIKNLQQNVIRFVSYYIYRFVLLRLNYGVVQ